MIRAVAANGSREVSLGGRFDATSADAQALYCGVGRLVDRGPNDGARLERVGDGAWCARAFAAQPTTIRALAVRGALLYARGRFASESGTVALRAGAARRAVRLQPRRVVAAAGRAARERGRRFRETPSRSATTSC